MGNIHGKHSFESSWAERFLFHGEAASFVFLDQKTAQQKGSENGAKTRNTALSTACGGTVGWRARLGVGYGRNGIIAAWSGRGGRGGRGGVEQLAVAQVSGAAFVRAVDDGVACLLGVLGILTAGLPSGFTSTHSTHHEISLHFTDVVFELHNNNNKTTAWYCLPVPHLDASPTQQRKQHR